MKVIVDVNPKDVNYPTLGKYNGKTMKVTAKKGILIGNRTEYYYHLEGAETEDGIPYAFADCHVRRKEKTK